MEEVDGWQWQPQGKMAIMVMATAAVIDIDQGNSYCQWSQWQQLSLMEMTVAVIDGDNGNGC